MRAAVLGFGLGGAVFHAPLIASTDGLEVSVIVTTNAERAARARKEHPGALIVGSAAEAWEHCDLVVVTTPNRFHVPLALEAFAHDLPVVMDKPMAVSTAEAERLLEAGGRLTVFQNRRWDGDFLTARRLVDEGALGDVFRLESRFERFRPAVAGGWRELGGAAEGGGQLLDLGPHLVDQARELLGHPLRVYAEVCRRRPGAEVDDDVFLALEHPRGARSHLWMGAVSALHGPRLRVSGLAGGFAVDGLDPQEGQLKDGLRPGDAGFGERLTSGVLVGPYGEAREVPIERGRYGDFYAAVRAWAQDGAPPPVDPHDSLAGMRVLEAAQRSAETGTIVDVETP